MPPLSLPGAATEQTDTVAATATLRDADGSSHDEILHVKDAQDVVASTGGVGDRTDKLHESKKDGAVRARRASEISMRDAEAVVAATGGVDERTGKLHESKKAAAEVHRQAGASRADDAAKEIMSTRRPSVQEQAKAFTTSPPSSLGIAGDEQSHDAAATEQDEAEKVPA